MLNLIRQKFGKLTIIEQSRKNKWGNYLWLCRCDCGKETIVAGGNLKSGSTKSCGCLQKEIVTKHGHNTRTKVSRNYQIWAGIIQRCTNPNYHHYVNYGGRGITVCKRWMKFQNFLEDMGEVPLGHQIDRINNNKGYYKGNCHWTTSKTNNRNKRNNHLETYNGRTQYMVDWAREFSIDQGTLSKRIKRGWSIGKALTTPIRKYRN